MIGNIPPVRIPTRLNDEVEAFCPWCNTKVTLAPGEFWPAFCECGTQLRETGISREAREEKRREFEGLVSFESRMTREGEKLLKAMGVCA